MLSMVCSKRTDGQVFLACRATANETKIVSLDLKTGQEKQLFTANNPREIVLNHDESVLFVAQESKLIAFNLESGSPTTYFSQPNAL